MTTHLRMLHVCEREFAGLPGDDPLQRRCDSCDRVVHNFDGLAPDARLELLRHAHARETTVCASLSLPPELARACRDGAAIAAVEPNSGELVRMAGVVTPQMLMPAPPQAGDPDTTWIDVPGDLEGVRSELDTIAPGFALTTDDGHHWRHFDALTGLAVDVVVVVVDRKPTVGVRIMPRSPAPRVAEWISSYRATIAMVLGPAWLTLVLALWIAGLPASAIVIGSVGVVALGAAIGACFLLVNNIGELAKLRAEAEWRAAWQRRFWPALQARLADPHMYR